MAQQQKPARSLSDYFPQPYVTEGAEANIEYMEGGKVRLTFVTDREAFAPVLERWTWNPARVAIIAGDRDVVIEYPAIKENIKE